MSTRDIRPTLTHASCEVCGRTLLRGERAQVYLDGGDRRSVCELCTSRAVNEGWVREGSMPTFDPRDGGSERRGSLWRRLRSRGRPQPAPNGDGSDVDGSAGAEPAPPSTSRPRRRAGSDSARARSAEHVREPRHVHAIPTGLEQRIAAAIDVFNGSEHRRTVAGVARSLGAPAVTVRPLEDRPGVVHIIAAWELCWYRYETDLSDEVPGVRLEGQGYELEELDDLERQPNAGSDEHGTLSF
ncbi:MAG: DUF4805 domain-containing protein [Actinomycetota bacterium]|nr:DUF4805 domain-containing protein [Actinomycetota bacterium]